MNSTIIPFQKCKIVCEVGSVHDGSFGNAKKLIEVAAQLGVDAIKFQTHIAPAESLREAPMPAHFVGEGRYEYFLRTGFSQEQWLSLKEYSEANAVEFLSSPFSVEAVELLEKIGVGGYKVPSGEVTNLPLIEVISKTSKPIILSSGMSNWAELDEAVSMILRYHDRLVVLQCTSEYPCPYEEVGLNIMLEMRDRYGLPVGLSDHTLTPYASFAAVALGASVIEKHLTFSRLMYGSDAQYSLEPDEFRGLVKGIRAIERILGSPVSKDSKAMDLCKMKKVFEKSIVSLVNIRKGTIITAEMVGLKKPGGGLQPKRLQEIIGHRARRDIPKDTLVQEADIYA